MTSETNKPNDSGQLPWETVFIENMRLLRERNALSQTELARLLAERGLPFHQQTVQRTETGIRPVRLNEAAVIAEVLGTQLSDMLQRHTADEQWLLELGRRLGYYLTRVEPLLQEGLDLVYSLEKALEPISEEEADEIRSRIPIYGLKEVLEAAHAGVIDLQREATDRIYSKGMAPTAILLDTETAVRALPTVSEAVGLVRPGPAEGGDMFVLFVVPEPGSDYTVEDARDALRQVKLPRVPLALVTLDELPRTRGGKLDAKALREFDIDEHVRSVDRRSLLYDPWFKARRKYSSKSNLSE